MRYSCKKVGISLRLHAFYLRSTLPAQLWEGSLLSDEKKWVSWDKAGPFILNSLAAQLEWPPFVASRRCLHLGAQCATWTHMVRRIRSSERPAHSTCPQPGSTTLVCLPAHSAQLRRRLFSYLLALPRVEQGPGRVERKRRAA